MDTKEKFYTTREAANILSHSKRQIQRKCESGEIKSIKPLKKYLIPESEIIRLEEEQDISHS
jgi:excisionase family DNA binding protein